MSGNATHHRQFLLIRNVLFAFALLSLGAASDAFAQANCESPNLLIILDQSGSMAFGSPSLVRTGKTCSAKSNCSPMTRVYQPSPGTTPRYSSYRCQSSRCEYTRWDVAQNAIREVVHRYGGTAPNYTNARVRFGLEFFSNSGTIGLPIPSTPPQFISTLNSKTATGGTYYINAFNTARAHLQSVVNADSVKRRPTSILFITDGDSTDSCSTTVTIARDLFNGTGTYRLQDNQGNIYKVKTYVIGFGSGLSSNGQTCLANIASAGGTARCNSSVAGCIAYYAADNDTQLNNAFSSIINNATQEVCDGLDNDCDGQTDESITRSCTTACGTGTQRCTNGSFGACSSGTPTAEKCNGRDDDCDGQVDENFGNKGRACSAGQGECRRTGTFVCNASGSGTRCSATAGSPTAEKCDGKDNDCDGSIDENFGNKGSACSVGQGECRRSGTFVCNANGSGTRCSATAGSPTAEKCDGKDNDCDGAIDEDFGNKGNACTVGQGICQRSGTFVCNANGSGLRCTATAGTPQPETCDGIDNDCDGQTDEGCQCINGQTRACFTGSQGCTKNGNSFNCRAPCKAGTQTCVTGRWATCTGQALPQTEKCNGKDDDCDGQVDENYTTKGNACSVGIGGCKRNGTFVCKSNGSGVQCSATAGAPKAETCNNKDDDCDGQTDENVTQACSTPCESGTETCSAGKWINCSARKPVAETCNGKDDDCDGQTDEDFSNKNKNCNVGKGECRRTGKWQCKSDGTGTECSAQPGPPAKETCNGKDDDCDGQTDEDWSKKGTPCTSGIGACERSGTFVCTQDGTNVQCSVPGGNPSAETCDGIDNDCDGQTDENLTQACSTACGSGVRKCVNAAYGACDAPQPQPETCNNKDDDCDGAVDNALKRECSTICGKGEETCVSGRWVFCDAQKPVKEECNGKDDDCNGMIDDMAPKKCSGACGTGTATCQSGQWTGCSGPQPQQETCNGKDDDCDGSIDNGIYKDCKGKCGAGRQLCNNGVWGDCNAPIPQPEVCDGKDNDCDGVADNAAACPSGTFCKEGKCELKCRDGECPGGSFCQEGLCKGDLCSRINCPSGKQCIAGKCVAPCDLVNCPSGFACEEGTCIKDDCYRNGCPAKQRCVRGVCQPDPCEGVSCGSGQFCRDGRCVDTCADVTCATGEKCADGKCVNDPKTSGPCKDVTCSDGETCEQGKCVTDPCKDVTCPKGRRCEQGVCDYDPCSNIKCPGSQLCREGQCFTNPNPSENPGGENPGNSGENPGNSGEKGVSNPGENPTTNPDGGPVTGTDTPSTNPEDGSGATNNDQVGFTEQTNGNPNNQNNPEGKRYQAPGCDCQTTGGVPFAPLFMFFFAMLLVVRRSNRA